MAFYCNRCGTGLPESARFCSSCGAVVSGPQFMMGRPLVRPLIGRQLAGVCLALAQAYNWDVALVRVFTVIGFFFSGGPTLPGGWGFPRRSILLVYEWHLPV